MPKKKKKKRPAARQGSEWQASYDAQRGGLDRVTTMRAGHMASLFNCGRDLYMEMLGRTHPGMPMADREESWAMHEKNRALARRYLQCLYETGKAAPDGELRKLHRIVVPLWEDDEVTNALRNLVQFAIMSPPDDEARALVVPPFEEGLLQLDAKEDPGVLGYIHYKVEAFDPDGPGLAVTLQHYSRAYPEDGSLYPGPRIEGLVLRANGPDAPAGTHCALADIEGHDAYYPMSVLYGMVGRAKLHWTTEEHALWKSFVVRTNRRLEAAQSDAWNAAGELADRFLAAIVAVNLSIRLSKGKPAARDPDGPKRAKPEARAAAPKDRGEYAVRRLGVVSILSPRHSRNGDGPRVVAYVTPAWQVRGFWRTAKSGKRVWVRPSVRRRAAMSMPSAEAVPVLLDATPRRKKTDERKEDPNA